MNSRKTNFTSPTFLVPSCFNQIIQKESNNSKNNQVIQKTLNKMAQIVTPLEGLGNNFRRFQRILLRGLEIFDEDQHDAIRPVVPDNPESLLENEELLDIGENCYMDANDGWTFNLHTNEIFCFAFTDASCDYDTRILDHLNWITNLETDPESIILGEFLRAQKHIQIILYNFFCEDVAQIISEFTMGWEDAIVIDETPGLQTDGYFCGFTNTSMPPEPTVKLGIWKGFNDRGVGYKYGFHCSIATRLNDQDVCVYKKEKKMVPCSKCGSLYFRLPEICNSEKEDRRRGSCCNKPEHQYYTIDICLECFYDIFGEIRCCRHWPNKPCYKCCLEDGARSLICKKGEKEFKEECKTLCQFNDFYSDPGIHVLHVYGPNKKRPVLRNEIFLSDCISRVSRTMQKSVQWSSVQPNTYQSIGVMNNVKTEEEMFNDDEIQNIEEEDRNESIGIEISEDLNDLQTPPKFVDVAYNHLKTAVMLDLHSITFWNKKHLLETGRYRSLDIDSSIQDLSEYRTEVQSELEEWLLANENESWLNNGPIFLDGHVGLLKTMRIIWGYAELPVINFSHNKVFRYSFEDEYVCEFRGKSGQHIEIVKKYACCAQCAKFKMIYGWCPKRLHPLCKDCEASRYKCCRERCHRGSKLCFECAEEQEIPEPYKYILCVRCANLMFDNAPLLRVGLPEPVFQRV